MVDPFAPEPAYLQVAAGLRAAIESGHLAPGDNLPVEETIARTYGVGRGTVRKAMLVLRSEGLVDAARGVPARVRESVKVQSVRPAARHADQVPHADAG